jgi:precorrin-2 dehydrogenase/sirohydrochlorin ferrochelatase
LPVYNPSIVGNTAITTKSGKESRHFPSSWKKEQSRAGGESMSQTICGRAVLSARLCYAIIKEIPWPMTEREHSQSETTDDQRQATPQAKLYPAFLSLQGKVCVVIGGGRVATRKVRSLLATGASVVVISPLLQAELQALLSHSLLRSIPDNYAAEHLDGVQLVFAATNDPEVNRRVAQDAHARGLWVNVADNPALSDFYVPATIQRGDLTLAISTGGSSPAFARYVREQLEQALSEALGQALEMIAQARLLILAQPKAQQAALWESLFALHLESLIATEGYPLARQRFEQWLKQSNLTT